MGRFVAFAVPLIGIVLLSILGHCEMSIYPGLRRKPPQSLQGFDMPSDFLAQLMEENARRRLQQQFEQQLELINMQMARQRQRQERERYRQQQLQALAENEAEEYAAGSGNRLRGNNQYEPYESYAIGAVPGAVNGVGLGVGEFSYKYPNLGVDGELMRERIPFAVGPADPRYYEEEGEDTRAGEDNDLDSRVLDEYEEYVPAETKVNTAIDAGGAAAAGVETKPEQVLTPVEASKQSDGSANTNFHRIKPQTAAAAAAAGVKSPPTTSGGVPGTRHDINALMDKLQKEGKAGVIVNGVGNVAAAQEDHNMVMRQHLGMDGETGMYLVALIAGVSAAVTVGLIALGIAWLHNRTKATADVEYPAYGVTGPNKDISPSGDRKLAQSAQMYHYQHQKQQIIAMENRQAVEGNCGLSDVESDDDNEEGDYTVYECPGLAPTGEMEVKNPLFLDETPLTPANATTGAAGAAAGAATPQQIVQQQKLQQIVAKKSGSTNNNAAKASSTTTTAASSSSSSAATTASATSPVAPPVAAAAAEKPNSKKKTSKK